MKIIIFLFFFLSIATINLAQNYGNWIVTDSLHDNKRDHAGIQLDDGNILVTGGNTWFRPLELTSNETEIYDITSQKWKVAVPMNKERSRHDMIKLNDGSILAIGGFNESTCEVLSKDYLKWTLTDSLKRKRFYGQRATLMKDGNVLLIGGYTDHPANGTSEALKECELYNYLKGEWVRVNDLNTGRYYHTATLLQNGKVLVTGGTTGPGLPNSCEMFDPLTEEWIYVAPMHYSRTRHSATLLPNGKVLITGGQQKYSELYDPNTNQWEVVGEVSLAFNNNTAIILKGEEYLLLVCDFEPGWELYSLKNFESIYYERFKKYILDPVIVKINDNRVLAAGGEEVVYVGIEPFIVPTSFCQIYDINYTSVKEIINQDHLLTDLSLSCYPNPSNNSTKISLSIPQKSQIILKVFDILGREIATLANGVYEVGKYVVTFDASKLPSGTYFYNLTTGSNSISKKMLLVK